jgi:Flp pilus assembly protein TadG
MQKQPRRRGATAVELAAVISVFVLLLFGILEYCLIIYTQNVVENAAREGARYAIVNSTDTNLVADTQSVVKNFLGGLDTRMANYSCNVYLADASGNSIGSASSATFGQYICVDVKLDYTPITPGLLHLATITIHSKSSMGSESN